MTPLFSILSDEADGYGTWHIRDEWMDRLLCGVYYATFEPDPSAVNRAVRCAFCMERYDRLERLIYE